MQRKHLGINLISPLGSPQFLQKFTAFNTLTSKPKARFAVKKKHSVNYNSLKLSWKNIHPDMPYGGGGGGVKRKTVGYKLNSG